MLHSGVMKQADAVAASSLFERQSGGEPHAVQTLREQAHRTPMHPSPVTPTDRRPYRRLAIGWADALETTESHGGQLPRSPQRLDHGIHSAFFDAVNPWNGVSRLLLILEQLGKRGQAKPHHSEVGAEYETIMQNDITLNVDVVQSLAHDMPHRT